MLHLLKLHLPEQENHYLMDQDLSSSVSQVVVVNGASIDLMVNGGVMWGFSYWSVSLYSRYAT
jgi:hypothetical protein